MMLKQTSIYLIIILVLSGCGTSKKNTRAIPKPSWVLAKPIQNDYYIGVGSAIKSSDGDNYMARAKKNALGSLSSEISVTISSQSVLHQYENKGGFTEDFQSLIRTSSNSFIEGYERMATFDDGGHYWEYYRLSKSAYEETKKQRLKEASELSLNYLKKGKLSKSENNITDALSNYVKGLEAIKPFWGESLEVKSDGKTIYLGSELFSNSIQLLKQITIVSKQKQITAKAGSNISGSDLTFVISNVNDTPLFGMPVLFYTNNKPIKNNRATSDKKGEVSYYYTHVPLSATNIIFKAKLDINALVSSVTQDAFFRKMLRAVDGNESNIQIDLNNPSFYIKTDEKNLENQAAKKALSSWLTNNNYSTLNTPIDADYTLLLSMTMSKNKKEQNMVFLTLNGSLKLFDKDNALLSSIVLPDIDAVHSTTERAANEANRKLEAVLERKMDIFLKGALK